ncbi:MAG TPA: hypothetical protein VF590_10195 [Isosphaeraceae bacterium]
MLATLAGVRRADEPREELQPRRHAPGRLRGDQSSGRVAIRDARTGRLEGTLAGHGAAVGGVAFSPDGRRVATASHDRTAKVWDSASFREIRALTTHSDRVHGVAYSPDGRSLATAGEDAAVRVWDVSSAPDPGVVPPAGDRAAPLGPDGAAGYGTIPPSR